MISEKIIKNLLKYKFKLWSQNKLYFDQTNLDVIINIISFTYWILVLAYRNKYLLCKL